MRICKVEDCSLQQIERQPFDLAIFGVGYEARCVHLAKYLERSNFSSTIALGFESIGDALVRRRHDAVFAECNTPISIVPTHDESVIYDLLRGAKRKFGKIPRVLVDYSSMSRIWVNAIINFFKFESSFDSLELYFSYTVGNHVDHTSALAYPHSDFQVRSIDCLQTLEGSSVRQRGTMAAFGLGFEWVTAFAAHEYVEPDEVFAFCADPGAFPDYGEIAQTKNEAFLKDIQLKRAASFPLRSIETVYRSLAEVVSPALRTHNVVLIPLGPKPHVLASMLLANRFPEIACLHVSGVRKTVLQVKPADPKDIVVTRVTLST